MRPNLGLNYILAPAASLILPATGVREGTRIVPPECPLGYPCQPMLQHHGLAKANALTVHNTFAERLSGLSLIVAVAPHPAHEHTGGAAGWSHRNDGRQPAGDCLLHKPSPPFGPCEAKLRSLPQRPAFPALGTRMNKPEPLPHGIARNSRPRVCRVERNADELSEGEEWVFQWKVSQLANAT